MDTQNLVHMANQIGTFFEAMPDREEALLGIADHLHKFWEPRMRQALLDYMDAEKETELRPIVVSAIRAHRSHMLTRH